jgi:hypothetical protein
MTQHSTLATDGQDGAPMPTVWNAVMTPEAFALACGYIVQTEKGHEAHRQLDQLVTCLLSSLGYGKGMAVFLAHVGSYHVTTPGNLGETSGE